MLQSPPQRCQRHSDGGARAKPEGNMPRRSLQKARTNQRAAIALLGEASTPEVCSAACGQPVSRCRNRVLIGEGWGRPADSLAAKRESALKLRRGVLRAFRRRFAVVTIRNARCTAVSENIGGSRRCW